MSAEIAILESRVDQARASLDAVLLAEGDTRAARSELAQAEAELTAAQVEQAQQRRQAETAQQSGIADRAAVLLAEARAALSGVLNTYPVLELSL